MEKVLNQEEIDAMVQAARSGGNRTAAAEEPPRVEPWDARRAGQIGREQVQAITLLHETFARSITHSLGAYLRVVFAATLVSAEHLTYREFLQRLPETTYLASCRLDPMGMNAALQLDLKVAFPMIDLLLGGEGRGMASAREITEIEEHILEGVAHIICRELGVAWQALSLDVNFEERLETGTARRLMSPEEKTLSLSFEVTMPEVRGGLNLALPAAVSNALLRKISAEWTHRRHRSHNDWRPQIMRRLLASPFHVELGAKDVRLPVNSISQLAPGQVLAFRRSVSHPASLLIAGQEMFHAMPARIGNTRAAKLIGAATEDLASPLSGRPLPSQEKTP